MISQLTALSGSAFSLAQMRKMFEEVRARVRLRVRLIVTVRVSRAGLPMFEQVAKPLP